VIGTPGRQVRQGFIGHLPHQAWPLILSLTKLEGIVIFAVKDQLARIGQGGERGSFLFGFYGPARQEALPFEMERLVFPRRETSRRAAVADGQRLRPFGAGPFGPERSKAKPFSAGGADGL